MKHYIVYLPSGEILRTGQCHDDILHLQGELVIEGVAEDSTQYVENGQVVSMPPKPNEFCVIDYTTKQWVDRRTEATQWEVVRRDRSRLLAGSDWTQLPDVPLATKAAWAEYRQALRDITSQSDPFNISWPTPPGTT